jgi:membrane-associated protease RseP (regulator of RpoE activity)
MDGLERNKHRNIHRDVSTSWEQDAITQTFDPTADDNEIEPSFFSKWTLPIGLFLLTIFTTLWAGSYQAYSGPVRGPLNFLREYPETLWRGIPFAGALLFILTTHELGHYLLSRIHRVPASLPLFIPGPPHFIGTFGAIIRMRGPIINRRALFDIGVAGPLAGFIVAVIALVIGLNLSTVVDRTATYGLQLGEPLLLQFISWLVIGSLPPQLDVVLHPIGFAAWFGLFVTSINLLPIGQLDGGHVAYALWGARQRTMAFVFVPILIVLGFVGWPGWFLWAFMTGIWGLGHPPVIDPFTPLGRGRTIVGWIALAVFVLTFAPVPFSFH